ncbi:uncharacterized protein LOC127098222 isoform X1 [Lathyrus oleraceus]|uniref:GRF-type domain-containing protein n=1 Tax=Pisum sativum TaxID=3888 RepID=A0A9D4WB39_PEA|nr:uncharacterized protein LOC127098222 isoform X1 [Pisum sativum]KAI5399523.1 hypothetical protein KIW84_064743 [Pisum sativum]
MHLMDQYEIVCQCKKGRMLRKCSNSNKNKNRMYYCCTKSKKLSNGRWDFGCQFFLWEDQLRRCLCGEGMCALVRYEDNGMEVCSLQGCSPAESGEGSGSSKSKQCQLCQVLSIKIKILEAKLEVAQSPEKHANTSSAILYEALEEVSDAVAGLSLDHQPNIS